MTTPVKAPIFRSHTFKQECAIADGLNKPLPKPVVGYEFSNKRKFEDKVSKSKSYD